jgi:hypothetical protein
MPSRRAVLTRPTVTPLLQGTWKLVPSWAPSGTIAEVAPLIPLTSPRGARPRARCLPGPHRSSLCLQPLPALPAEKFWGPRPPFARRSTPSQMWVHLTMEPPPLLSLWPSTVGPPNLQLPVRGGLWGTNPSWPLPAELAPRGSSAQAPRESPILLASAPQLHHRTCQRHQRVQVQPSSHGNFQENTHLDLNLSRERWHSSAPRP